MLAAGAVAVFALLARQQVRRVFVAGVAGVVTDHLFRVPARDVAGDALGVVQTADVVGAVVASGLERLGGLGMRRVFPDLVGRLVTLGASLHADIRIFLSLDRRAGQRTEIARIV